MAAIKIVTFSGLVERNGLFSHREQHSIARFLLPVYFFCLFLELPDFEIAAIWEKEMCTCTAIIRHAVLVYTHT